jgi:outer membrane protein assembly factor BamE (lipoprotein component of BamABCDE complex)
MRALLASALLAGCALTEPKPVERPLGPGEIISARTAEKALSVGTSTKADVRAALGEATVVDFASGYDVWVYRERTGSELVLLFEPSGVLAKTRVR